MWKLKLDDNVWLADGVGDLAITTNKDEAWLLPDMPSVQEQLNRVRRFMSYPNATVIFDDGQVHQKYIRSG